MVIETENTKRHVGPILSPSPPYPFTLGCTHPLHARLNGQPRTIADGGLPRRHHARREKESCGEPAHQDHPMEATGCLPHGWLTRLSLERGV